MTSGRDRSDQRDQVGQSRFAQRGVSHEERMSEDDSARRFPGEGRTQQDARFDQQRQQQQRGAERQGGSYGSGGSYGYGGGFEHGGERGYQDQPQRGAYGRGEEFYESSGGFGRDVSGYGREGLGYPGAGEDRWGSPGSAGSRRAPQKSRDDERQGYSQDSGYAQSGGERKEGERGDQGGQGSGYGSQGSGYGSGAAHSDGRGHEGGGRGQRFFGSSSGGQAGRGRFYGRTPQGYTRSDDRIREDVCDQLSHGHIDPSEISVTVADGVVTLEGYASSRSEKFHIEEVADAVLGVKDVDNRVRVRREGSQSQNTQSQSAQGKSTQGSDDALSSPNSQGATSQSPGPTRPQQPNKDANEVTESSLDAGPPKGRGTVNRA